MLIFYNALLPLFKAGAVCSVFIAAMECMFKIALSHEVKEIRMTFFFNAFMHCTRNNLYQISSADTNRCHNSQSVMYLCVGTNRSVFCRMQKERCIV